MQRHTVKDFLDLVFHDVEVDSLRLHGADGEITDVIVFGSREIQFQL